MLLVVNAFILLSAPIGGNFTEAFEYSEEEIDLYYFT